MGSNLTTTRAPATGLVPSQGHLRPRCCALVEEGANPGCQNITGCSPRCDTSCCGHHARHAGLTCWRRITPSAHHGSPAPRPLTIIALLWHDLTHWRSAHEHRLDVHELLDAV